MIRCSTPEGRQLPIIVFGNGVYAAVLSRVLSYAFTSNQFGSRVRAVLPVFLDDAIRDRGRMFRDGTAVEAAELVVVEQTMTCREILVEVLREGRGAELPVTRNSLFVREFEGLCHDLKYLFYPRGSPSSWYFKNPFEDANRSRELSLGRVVAVERRFAIMAEAVGSAVEESLLRKAEIALLPEVRRFEADCCNDRGAHNQGAGVRVLQQSIGASPLRKKLENPMVFLQELQKRL